MGKGRNYEISRTIVDSVPEDPKEYRDERKRAAKAEYNMGGVDKMNRMNDTSYNKGALKFGRRLASCSPTNFGKP